MFLGCSSLIDIKPLENREVPYWNNFSYMFSGYSLVSDIKRLLNWMTIILIICMMNQILNYFKFGKIKWKYLGGSSTE